MAMNDEPSVCERCGMKRLAVWLFVGFLLVGCGASDQDGDGWPACESVQAMTSSMTAAADSSPQPDECDCDDYDASIHPGAPEVFYDYVDQNCNGDSDEWDQDGDGALEYGNEDCDDQDSTIYPGADEVPYDNIDQNCDGKDLIDVDGDGQALMHGDCDDNNPDVYINAPELCNGIDDGCNGKIDDGITITYYRDADGDYYGDPNNAVTSCSGQPEGYITMAADCDDANKTIHPYSPETCDGVDQDCDGKIDEDFDKDGDGYATCGGDCNDGSVYVHPDAIEVCDKTDEDCDGTMNPDGLVSVFNGPEDWTPDNVLANFDNIQEAVDYAYVYVMDIVVCPKDGGHYGFSIGKYASFLSVVGVDLSPNRDHSQPILISQGAENGLAGIVVSEANSVYISNFELAGIESEDGGGIAVYDSTNVGVWWTRIVNNTATNGGGVYLHDTSNFTMDYCDVSDNVAELGGGIYFNSIDGGSGPVGEAYIAIHDSSIVDNSATRGEAIYHTGTAGSVTLDAVEIAASAVEAYYLNNTSAMVYGVAWIEASFSTLKGSVAMASGAKYVWNGDVDMYCRQYGYCDNWVH